MDFIASIVGRSVGFFTLSIISLVIEFIVNKSINNKWGYKITITIFSLNVALLFFGIWFDNRGV
jgi:hypothetical protein